MKEDIKLIVDGLKMSPSLLENMMSQIPEEIMKTRRIRGKWSIHEHACHLADAQIMILGRFRRFSEERNPEFIPFLPGKTDPDAHLMTMELSEALNSFANLRSQLLDVIRDFSEADWTNEAKHPEYVQFNPYIFLRHVLMHDHFHMYRIEELWLTQDDYLRKK